MAVKYGMGRLLRLPLGRMLAVGTVALLLAACNSGGGDGVSQLDESWHHYTQGMQALEEGRMGAAREKIDRALDRDESFAPALAAKGLLLAMRAAEQEEVAHREVDVTMAMDLLKRAREEAKIPQEKFIVQVTTVRGLGAAMPEGWVEMVIDHHRYAGDVEPFKEAALTYYQNRDAADYFLAVALFHDDFIKSKPYLTKVVGARNGGKWQGPAGKLLERIQKIEQAGPIATVSGQARQIAIKESVVRGDVAALLVDELKLDRLFKGRLPVASQEAGRQAEFVPADVLNHPFKEEVGIVMKWNLRGLEPNYDESTRAWLFRPQAPVSRKELALALEDVLIRITGDETIATRMVGTETSPYPDVKAGSPWFNAISTVVTRRLMDPELTGEFRPDAPASGADLLLAIFKLRNVVNIH